MNLLIKNANIIDAYESFYGDILIIDGIITEIGKEINKDKIDILGFALWVTQILYVQLKKL